jgi:hypothetical protein
MHRFLHLGDLHLGPNDRNTDRIAALDQAIREGLAQPLAAWLFPGDLNDGPMTIFDKNVLTGRFQIMANHAPVVVCYGNHDLPGDLDFLARLDALCPIYVIDRPQVLEVRTATGVTAAIFVLPYPHRAGFVAAGVASDNLVDAARAQLDLIFMDAAAKLDDARKAGMITLMIGHVNVAGSIVSSGQPNIGKEIELDAALLDRLGRIYIGLNHIHKRQQYYAGSMCRLDWGEIDPKSYTEITYCADGGRGWGGYAGDGPEDGYPDGWAYDTRWCPLDVAPMYHVDGELTREGFTFTFHGDVVDGVVNQTCPESWAGCEVRVRYRYVAADKALLNFDLVKAPFAGAKRIDTDPIAEHTRAIRAPEVAAAATLDDKVMAIAKGAGVAWTAGLTDKLSLLQQPDGAAFLNTVEDRLTIIDAGVPQEVCQ